MPQRLVSWSVLALATLAPTMIARGQSPATRAPDSRFKADLLLVVAHPDDESAVSGLLSRLVLDQKRRVAVIYGTRGDGGGNAVGPEQAASLGAIREIEGRKAAAALGIDLVWFLDGKDTPSQDVLQSLETWRHGASLEQVVRLVRLTRPEVILTWLPQFVIGENHGDHQAAGVLATEAFDLAGDPTAFPSQLAAARNPSEIANLTEGLRPWQPKKLYFFSDRGDGAVFRDAGPRYRVTDRSTATGEPFYRSQAKSLANHLTQGSGARLSAEAIATGDFAAYLKAMAEFSGSADEQLIFGKSVVGGDSADQIFTGIDIRPAAWRPIPRSVASVPAVSLGGPWRFYREFARTHGIEAATGRVGVELGLEPGAEIRLPVVLVNNGAAAEWRVGVSGPAGWSIEPMSEVIAMPAGATVDGWITVRAAPVAGPAGSVEVVVTQGERQVGVIRLVVRALATMPF